MAQQTFNNTKITVEFDEDYQSRTNINSGENISSLFAKIRRFILDLKAVCFSGSYNDLSDTPDVVTKEYVDPIKSQAAINRTTLGTQCKNLLKNTAVTTTINGVTFTVNNDKSITVNGTATSMTQMSLGDIVQNGNYILTGCPSGGSTSTYMLSLAVLRTDGTTTYADETGNGRSIVFDSEKHIRINFLIQINPGVTVSNLTFKPMLRYADITDDTYEPYKESVDERLIQNKSDIALNKSTLGYQCKNLFNSNAVNWYQPTKTSIAEDGTITSTTTSDSRTWSLTNSEYFLTLPAGKYIVKTITESLDDTISANENIRGYNGTGSQVFEVYPNIVGTRTTTFTIDTVTTIGIMFKLFTQTCKIMIYDADITDDAYEPYQPSLQERINALEARIAALGG